MSVDKLDEDTARRHGVVLMELVPKSAPEWAAICSFTGKLIRIGTIEWVSSQLATYQIPINCTIHHQARPWRKV